jgi:hypothetical protein
MEIEGCAGGVQQGAGEFLFHCHIAAHYFSGMWGFWLRAPSGSSAWSAWWAASR